MEFLKNITPRKYQEEIAKTCIEKNTLVVLPTGLGKTLIALMVAIERMKKYPTEKILILAPTKPLAEQHVESFKKKSTRAFCRHRIVYWYYKTRKKKKDLEHCRYNFFNSSMYCK